MKKFISLILFLALTANAAEITLLPSQPEGFLAKLWRCNIRISCYRALGSTITTINATDLISASRSTINTNFSNLNNDKIEVSTTTLPFLTTLDNVTRLGVIASSTWRGSIIGVPFGGTGSSTLSANRILLGNGSGVIGVVNGFGTSGQFLTSNGANLAPTFQSGSFDTTAKYNLTGLWTFNGLSVGIGTTTASTTLSVQGNSLVSGTSTAGQLVATSSLTINNMTVFAPSKLLFSSGEANYTLTATSTVLAVNIPANTLSTGNSLKTTVYINNLSRNNSEKLIFDIGYGAASTTQGAFEGTGLQNYAGTIDLVLTANGTNAQKLSLFGNLSTIGYASTSPGVNFQALRLATTTSISIDSTINQRLIFDIGSLNSLDLKIGQITGSLMSK